MLQGKVVARHLQGETSRAVPVRIHGHILEYNYGTVDSLSDGWDASSKSILNPIATYFEICEPARVECRAVCTVYEKHPAVRWEGQKIEFKLVAEHTTELEQVLRAVRLNVVLTEVE